MKVTFGRGIAIKRTSIRIQFGRKSLTLWGAHLVTGLRHICGCTVDSVQFPLFVMLPILMKIHLTMIQIRILPMLLLGFSSSPRLLPVSQPAYPRETVPTKLLYHAQFIRIAKPLPVTIRIPISNFIEREPINENQGYKGVCNMMVHVESP